jgi:hypothetical protein
MLISMYGKSLFRGRCASYYIMRKNLIAEVPEEYNRYKIHCQIHCCSVILLKYKTLIL